jgi:hypothetical protein
MCGGHACNPSYSAGGDRMAVWGQLRQKIARPYLRNNLGLVVPTYGPNYSEVDLVGVTV